MTRRITALLSRVLDLRMAFAGAAFMGTLVFAVNASHGAGPALVAAAKQATYTFFFAGLVMQWSRRLAERAAESPTAAKQGRVTRPSNETAQCLWSNHLASTLDGRARAVAAATLFPSLLAVGLTFGVHSLRGTPDPVASTVPTLIFGPPSFFVWALRCSAQRSDDHSQASKGAGTSSSTSVASPSDRKI